MKKKLKYNSSEININYEKVFKLLIRRLLKKANISDKR